MRRDSSSALVRLAEQGAAWDGSLMPSSELSMPVRSGETSLLRQSQFWIVQLVGWLLALLLYFWNQIRGAFHAGLGPTIVMAVIFTGLAAAIASSAALGAAYLRMPPRWLTGFQAIPIAFGLSLLAALPWTVVVALLVAGVTDLDDHVLQANALRHFFGTFALLVVWSLAFFWFVLSDRVRKAQAEVQDAQVRASRAEALAVAAKGSDQERADGTPAEARGASPNAPTNSAAVPWRPDDRVPVREGKSVRLYRVGDIAYIRAAGDYTEVHLLSGQVAFVMQRLRHWEARLPESFVRIHRSTLVNIELSEELARADGAWHVRLRGCSEALTVSRRFAQAVKAKIAGRQGVRPS